VCTAILANNQTIEGCHLQNEQRDLVVVLIDRMLVAKRRQITNSSAVVLPVQLAHVGAA
jgi:hypothetical protein